MADPTAATLTQLRNIQGKTGKSIAELHSVLAASGLAKVGERRTLLMEHFKLGYGDANTVALTYGKPLPVLDGKPAQPAGTGGDPGEFVDPLDTIYVGPKAPLRTLHEAVMKLVRGFGSFEEAPKKAHISLRRKKQFAMVGPATKDQIEIGLNVKPLAPSPRLKAQLPGGMCQYTVRLASANEVDAELTNWLRAAYDAAG